jgi:hypothetical protein
MGIHVLIKEELQPNVFGHQYIALPLALAPNYLPGILGLSQKASAYS